MNRDDRDLDQFIRDWWIQGPDDSRFRSILNLSLAERVTSVVPLARALPIIDEGTLAPSLAGRVRELRERLLGLIARAQQVDSVGDLDNEPEAVFAILGDDAAAIESFDADRLREARIAHQSSRAAAGEAFLQALGWNAFVPATRSALEWAVADLKERERFESWGLFVGTDRKDGIGLGIKFVVRDSGRRVIEIATTEVRQQAEIVSSLFLEGAGWEMSVEWPASFAGESIGLPLSIAALTAQGAVPRDALLASTGRLDISGNVLGVARIGEKIEAARRLGIRRVVVPKENLAEARSVAENHLAIIPIAHTKELSAALRQPLSAVDFDFSALARLVRASVRDYGLYLVEEIERPHGRCFVVANTSGKAHLWVYKNGRVTAQGSAGETLDAANILIQERVPPDPEVRPSQSFDTVSPEFRDKSRMALEEIGASHEAAHDHEVWRLQLKRGRSTATVVSYSTGKCVLQGTAPAWQLALEALNSALAPVGGLKAGESAIKTESAGAVDPGEPHIGTDEAGKGDYFGPLVSAAVYVDAELAETLRAMGVRDSKTLSDRRVNEIAEEIRRAAEGKYAITPINPPKFNELYVQFKNEGKNLNALLAWGHARSIERLLNAPAGRAINPKYVLVDQFADARYVEERTQRAGIPVHQRPKAESDIAVAAASILARDAFLNWLEKWSTRVGVVLPKGASSSVITAAKDIARRWGRAGLGDLAKLSFRTTQQVFEGIADNVTGSAPPWAGDREFARDS